MHSFIRRRVIVSHVRLSSYTVSPLCSTQRQTTNRGYTPDGITQFVTTLGRRLARRNCPHDFEIELMLVYGTTNENDVWELLFNECFDFWEAKSTRELADIGDGTDVFLKAFYDGGTYWNDARETTKDNGEVVNVLSKDPGEKIDEYNTTVSRTAIIGLPDQLSNFDDCAIRSAMCCWVQDRQAGDNNGKRQPLRQY